MGFLELTVWFWIGDNHCQFPVVCDHCELHSGVPCANEEANQVCTSQL
ncbi:hypothetical protein Enr10x_23030 [Gimesia panareensis]|uniref:Uncharacterized protein n=1 Tax=Gimesia panareensis TaxID=2527978 RepID=A0A517Q5S1_9PLAN|nr:hypothetical protein Enr10x_23030 [Gimesia panareensis]